MIPQITTCSFKSVALIPTFYDKIATDLQLSNHLLTNSYLCCHKKKNLTLEAIMKRVVSGFSFFKVSAIWVPSMLETKWALGPVL